MIIWRQVIAVLWELPQTLLGWVFVLWFWVQRKVAKIYSRHGIIYVVVWEAKFSAISLGGVILLSAFYHHYGLVDVVEKHEYGHTIQSLLLGPLYLILVGLPSLLLNVGLLIKRPQTVSQAMAYYEYYPENWADKLGHVDENDKMKREKFYRTFLKPE